MIDKSFVRRVFAGTMIVLFGLSSIIREQTPDGKKLPPIHYVRSRDYDVRHIAESEI